MSCWISFAVKKVGRFSTPCSWIFFKAAARVAAERTANGVIGLSQPTDIRLYVWILRYINEYCNALYSAKIYLPVLQRSCNTFATGSVVK